MAFRAVYLTRSRSHRVHVATDGNTGKGLTMPIDWAKAQREAEEDLAERRRTGVWGDPDDDGCKDCCSLLMGAFSLTGLVAVFVPMLLYQLKRGKSDEPR